jgi:hypothetical protein
MNETVMKDLDEERNTVKVFYDELGWCEGVIWKKSKNIMLHR